ncbi:MAG: phage Gp37/Gp68 family protein [Rickettsiales bacterium]|jgi:protein gp37|nr:phage Gp37/Gp68 family protein [Rickettsiales bacterium]
MGSRSRIEWTGATWNPLIGCTKYSAGCENCYAERIALMLQRQGKPDYKNGFALNLLPERLEVPLHWKKPRVVFVNSMSDLFHDDVPLAFIRRVFDIMNRADWHMYQVLTKRSARMRELTESGAVVWSEHIWPGVTIEADEYRNRLDDLKAVKAAHKWLSLEPLIAPVRRLDLDGIDWVITCGESGNNARPMNIDWVRDIRDWTHRQGKAFFFKKYSERDFKDAADRPALLDGELYKEWPEIKSGALSLF